MPRPTVRTPHALAVIVSRLAEGESIEQARSAARVGRSAFFAWKASDPAFAAALKLAEERGRFFLKLHARHEAQRAAEERRKLYHAALISGDTSGLLPDQAARAEETLAYLWRISWRTPAEGFEIVGREGADGVLRQHIWKVRKSPKKSRPLCGAKTRDGSPCEARAVPFGKRCRMHGGVPEGR